MRFVPHLENILCNRCTAVDRRVEMVFHGLFHTFHDLQRQFVIIANFFIKNW